jgi:ssDNA-specific exonuclease RecJ
MAEEIVFTQQNNSGKNDELISIPYEDLIDVRKSTTGLVFGAIFIVTKENEKIWFSSLPDREGIYGTLKHFWQAKLFQKSNSAMKNSKGQKTRMGQKLLGIVKDSEQTLSNAAVQLYDQGKQIDHTMDVMADLHNDLDIADNLVKDIDSWIGRWRLPSEYKTVDPVVVNKSDIPEVFEYEILFTKLETSQANTRQVGSLRISNDGLTILNIKMKTEFHFRWADVSKLRVVTPWELMVIKYQIGKPDLVYGLVSANMVAILKLLDNCAKYKLTYDTPPEPILCTRHPQTTREKESLYTTGM